MKIFDKYSDYYDLLYKDKDYAAEVDYVNRLIKKYLPDAKSILDMGCGTGNHDFLLTERGYHVTGIDNSEVNIEKANSKLAAFNSKSSILDFKKGDIRNIRLNQTFDVVISLFHVMSYQNTNDDLGAAFTTAKVHLKQGGLFIFDCWYGPAVLTDRPEVRVKSAEDKAISVIRIAEPEMIANENIVKVNYQVIIKDKLTEKVNELREIHKMRYLFKPEIEDMLDKLGFAPVGFTEWMTEQAPGFDTWNVCFVARTSTE